MNHYERAGIVSLEEVLSAVRQRLENPLAPKMIEFLGRRVKVSGLRLRTFAESPLCCSNPNCEARPAYFAIERDKGGEGASPDRPFHLNLYGKNERGDEVMFTHDHTLARGLGGADSIENTTTMCLPCNQKKSRLEGALANRRRREQQGEALHGSLSEKRVERQRAMLLAERGILGMDEAAFKGHCHEQAMGWLAGKPFKNRGKADPRRRMAEALGMSKEGYAYLRHIHGERMKKEMAIKGPIVRARLGF